MRRFSEIRLSQWINSKHRKPLVIRGARQVGKSTLVRQFAEKQGLVLHEVNLERHLSLSDLFKSQNTQQILRELEFISGKGPINTKGSLLFLDEIQAIPIALQTLRYFYEDYPELPVITAGSLLEFALADHSFPMPVGRIEYLFMGPVSFEEYISAKNEDKLFELLQNYLLEENFPQTAHERLLELQRQYLLVGGMPEAVQRYLDTEDINQVFEVQTSIVETYRDDFSKYTTKNELLRVHKVFDHVPLAAGDKFKYSKVDLNSQAREVKKSVDLLAKAGIIYIIYHTDASGIPLKATVNDKVFKSYFLDCGLMNRICGINWISSNELVDQKFINEGRIAEQFIAQQLLYMGKLNERPTLHYWLREGRSGNAEVDFVLQVNNKIIPVEVKGGMSGTLKSIQQFICQKAVPLAVRFDLNLPSFQHVSHTTKYHSKDRLVEFDLLALPLYMVEQLPRLLEEVKE